MAEKEEGTWNKSLRDTRNKSAGHRTSAIIIDELNTELEYERRALKVGPVNDCKNDEKGRPRSKLC